MEKAAKAKRGQMAYPSLDIWVTGPTLVYKSPDSKFKAFVLYPFFQITKQDYTKWKEPDMKYYILYDSLMSNFQKWQNYRDKMQTSGCPEQGVGAETGQTGKTELSGRLKCSKT